MKKRILIPICAVLVAVFLYSAYQLGRYLIASLQAKRLYNDLQQTITDNRPSRPSVTQPPETQDGTVPTDSAPTRPEEPTQPVYVSIQDPVTGQSISVLPEFADLYVRNPELVGWLEIPGTVVSYPVMHTPKQPDYYLTHNFEKKWDTHGCLYIEEECNTNTPTDNIIIYGHRMEDGSMFSTLAKYLNESYYKDHPYLYFDTLTQRHTYEIISVFKTTAILGEGFPYHTFIDAATDAEYLQYVNTCKDLALYDITPTAKPGDKLITLSTCEYSQDYGRLVVVAKLIA